ncbi:MAG: carbohydrate kinase family protein [Spirochaetota bacterium]
MILHVGEALIDFIPVTDSAGYPAYRPAPGGSPYNSAIATSRLGIPAYFVGRISRDFFGDQLVDNLRDNGVDTSLLVRSSQPSTLAFVKKTENGEARYAFFVTDAADRGLVPCDLPKELPGELECIQFGSISLIADPVGRTILSYIEEAAPKVVTSFDPNVRTVLLEDEADYRGRVDRACRAAGIVKISDEDLAWYKPGASSAEAASQLLAGNTRLVVVTHGEEGAWARTERTAASVDAVAVEVSDTVGAGDSFHSAILAWLAKHDKLSLDALDALSEDDLRGMLSFAVRVAAVTCSRPGADPPHEHEVAP